MPAMTSVITIASASSRRSMDSDNSGTHCSSVVRSAPFSTAGICAAAQPVVAAGSAASSSSPARPSRAQIAGAARATSR